MHSGIAVLSLFLTGTARAIALPGPVVSTPGPNGGFIGVSGYYGDPASGHHGGNGGVVNEFDPEVFLPVERIGNSPSVPFDFHRGLNPHNGNPRARRQPGDGKEAKFEKSDQNKPNGVSKPKEGSNSKGKSKPKAISKPKGKVPSAGGMPSQPPIPPFKPGQNNGGGSTWAPVPLQSTPSNRQIYNPPFLGAGTGDRKTGFNTTVNHGWPGVAMIELEGCSVFEADKLKITEQNQALSPVFLLNLGEEELVARYKSGDDDQTASKNKTIELKLENSQVFATPDTAYRVENTGCSQARILMFSQYQTDSNHTRATDLVKQNPGNVEPHMRLRNDKVTPRIQDCLKKCGYIASRDMSVEVGDSPIWAGTGYSRGSPPGAGSGSGAAPSSSAAAKSSSAPSDAPSPHGKTMATSVARALAKNQVEPPLQYYPSIDADPYELYDAVVPWDEQLPQLKAAVSSNFPQLESTFVSSPAATGTVPNLQPNPVVSESLPPSPVTTVLPTDSSATPPNQNDAFNSQFQSDKPPITEIIRPTPVANPPIGYPVDSLPYVLYVGPGRSYRIIRPLPVPRVPVELTGGRPEEGSWGLGNPFGPILQRPKPKPGSGHRFHPAGAVVVEERKD